MEVKNRLSRTLAAVHLQPISAGAVLFIQERLHLFRDLCQTDGFLVADLKIVLKMALGNHETMPFSDTEFVRDHIKKFIFQDVVFWLYAAKYAIHIYPPQNPVIKSF